MRGGSAAQREVTSAIDFQNISLHDDPERGGGSAEENKGEALQSKYRIEFINLQQSEVKYKVKKNCVQQNAEHGSTA